MIYNKIGKEIARIRKMNNISQQRLADVSGYHVKALSNIERGIAQPSLEKVDKILRIMGYKLDVVKMGEKL